MGLPSKHLTQYELDQSRKREQEERQKKITEEHEQRMKLREAQTEARQMLMSDRIDELKAMQVDVAKGNTQLRDSINRLGDHKFKKTPSKYAKGTRKIPTRGHTTTRWEGRPVYKPKVMPSSWDLIKQMFKDTGKLADKSADVTIEGLNWVSEKIYRGIKYVEVWLKT